MAPCSSSGEEANNEEMDDVTSTFDTISLSHYNAEDGEEEGNVDEEEVEFMRGEEEYERETERVEEMEERETVRWKFVCNDKYARYHMVGMGSYGKVFLAEETRSSRIFALKKLMPIDTNSNLPSNSPVDPQYPDGIHSSSLREIDILKRLSDSEYIAKLVEAEEHVCPAHKRWCLYLVFEFYNMDLHRFMKTKRYCKDKLIKRFMYQILSGLAYMHANGVWHRDLKPQNLLLDEDAVCIKIGDFGLGRTHYEPGRSYTFPVVTQWYRAPELLLGTHIYNPSIDIWSVGCIFAELYIKQPLFYAFVEIGQLFQIFEILGTPNEETMPGVSAKKFWNPDFPKFQFSITKLRACLPDMDCTAMDLLLRMFTYDPERRISAKAALRHPYFHTDNNMMYAPKLPRDVRREFILGDV